MHDLQDSEPFSIDIGLDSPCYLRANVKIEPLFCGWLAWSHLLSPVQSAMNLAFRYLPLLQSFVTNPMVHVAATRDPKLFGGPFVHLSPDSIPKVKDLIAKTKKHCTRLLKLAEDVKAFDASLQDGAKGFSLNEHYSRLPPSLAGMVELMYDINNHPRLRLIEELLYAEYGQDLCKNVQEVTLSTVKESDRPFFLSTPRLPPADALTITTAFSNPAVDSLTSMRVEPLALRELDARLGLIDTATHYGHLFSAEPPPRNQPQYIGDDVRLRYFGHACVLIQTRKLSILIDPMFASEPAITSETMLCPRLTISDLPDEIDYVVLTHCHQDHLSPEMLLQIRSRVRRVVVPTNNRGNTPDPSMKRILAELGFFDVVALDYFEAISFRDGRLISIPFPGEHSDLDIYSKQALFLDVKGRKFLFFVDSDGWDLSLYQRIAKQLAPEHQKIDALFLGMECHGAPLTWLYGPLLSKPVTRRDDESRRLSGSNFERARQIVQQFNCTRVYVYAMGQEPWLRHVMGLEYAPDSIQLTESDKLVSYCRTIGKTSERLYGSTDFIF
jgi:L-ascorbate metabolism protein UlaG (beta-lactamase superfamily)